jgi:hypothetical protein
MATRIFCPICSWAPRPSDRWQCRPGCYTVWNTFETHALCPGCRKQWTVTVCLACAIASLHEEWYHEDEQDTVQEHAGAEREEELVGAR